MAIYFIQADDGPVKIGYTSNQKKRVANMRTSSHAELKLLSVIDGTRSLEAEMHSKFSGLRIRGEWFRPEEPLLSFLATLPPAEPHMSPKRHFKSLPKDESARIEEIWFDTSISVKTAVRKTGFSLGTLYNQFGPAGRPIMPPGKAVAMQAKSLKARIGHRMPEREALKHWRDPRLTIGEAIQLMTGWSARTAYQHLGPRGLPAGPRGK